MTDVTRSIFFAERIIANVTDLRERASKYIRSWGKHARNAKASATAELLKRPEGLVPMDPQKAAGALNILFRPF